jgi:hypothetical protein
MLELVECILNPIMPPPGLMNAGMRTAPSAGPPASSASCTEATSVR